MQRNDATLGLSSLPVKEHVFEGQTVECRKRKQTLYDVQRRFLRYFLPFVVFFFPFGLMFSFLFCCSSFSAGRFVSFVSCRSAFSPHPIGRLVLSQRSSKLSKPSEPSLLLTSFLSSFHRGPHSISPKTESPASTSW